MKNFIYPLLTLTLTLGFFSKTFANCTILKDTSGTLAILEIQDKTNSNFNISSVFEDIIITNMVKNSSIQIVERSQVQMALKATKFETSGLTQDSRVKIGEWLGAKTFLMGSLSKLLGEYRLDLRLIDVESGGVLCAGSSSGKVLVKLPDEATENLSQKAAIRPEASSQNIGRLNFNVKVVNSLFNERPIPFQKVKIIDNNQLIATTATINQLNETFKIPNIKLSEGLHIIKFIFGTVDENGKWIDSHDKQPQQLSLFIKKDKEINYKCKQIFDDLTINYKCKKDY
jgi:TolB-like protein